MPFGAICGQAIFIYFHQVSDDLLIFVRIARCNRCTPFHYRTFSRKNLGLGLTSPYSLCALALVGMKHKM